MRDVSLRTPLLLLWVGRRTDADQPSRFSCLIRSACCHILKIKHKLLVAYIV
jgi:hypothetical protein